MEIIKILSEAALQVYDNVKQIIHTEEAGKSCGVGAGGDVSKKIDIIAEKTVINYLKKKKVACVVIGEECGIIKLFKNPKGYIIMDAVDGTDNALRGIPFFCCSLAFAINNKLKCITDSVIIDLYTRDLYRASKGKGAYLNNKKIFVNKKKITNVIVSINTSSNDMDLLKKLLSMFQQQNHTRRFGANALEMAFIARGLIDVMISLRPSRIQDIAAGYLLIKEAGGLILNTKLKTLDKVFNYKTKIPFIATTNKSILTNLNYEDALGGI